MFMLKIDDIGDKKMAKTVNHILKLLPTHFVSNIRHQHRCNPQISSWVMLVKISNVGGKIEIVGQKFCHKTTKSVANIQK